MVNYDALSDSVISIIFAVVSFQFLFPGNYFIPLDRRLSGLLGAVLCALVAYLLPGSASIAGEHVDIEVLVILVSIMVINFVLMQQEFVEAYIFKLQEVIKADPNMGFWLVSFASFFISPFVTNDGLCLLLVNPVLDALVLPKENDKPHADSEIAVSASKDKLNESNIVSNRFYFMLTISSSSNIGSVMTFAGNPQNIIIAKSLIDLMSGGLFFGLMLLPATVIWVITVLHMNNCRIIAIKKDAEVIASGGLVQVHTLGSPLLGPIVEVDENDDRTMASMSSHTRPLNSVDSVKNSFSIEGPNSNPAQSSDRGTATSSMPGISFMGRASMRARESSTNASSHRTTNRLASASVGSHRMSSVGSAGRQSYVEHLSSSVRRSSVAEAMSGGISLVSSGIRNVANAGAVSYCAFFLFALLILIELANLAELVLIFAVVAVLMVAGVVLISYYSGQPKADHNGNVLSNQQRREGIEHFVNEMFLDVDYNLIIIFVGLFIVAGAMVDTRIPAYLWEQVAGNAPFENIQSIILISIYTIVGSQLVGNVAVILMAEDEVTDLEDNTQRFGWLLLSWVSTVAGNFTLAGSAANIIVAEKAARHIEAKTEITSNDHFRVMGLWTLFCITLGVLIIYGEALMMGYV